MSESEPRFIPLAESYEHVRRTVRNSNFYYSFLLLDQARCDSLSAIYAFMRRCDDLVDCPNADPQAFDAWRREMGAALGTGYPADPMWPAFIDTVRRHGIPQRYFYDHMEGVASDLVRPKRIRTFGELYQYCYRVASTAGMCLIHVYGYRSQEALLLAEKCGVAFQITNILRDVREDLEMDRIYLAAEDLARYRVTEDDLRLTYVTPQVRDLFVAYASRARSLYHEAQGLLKMVTPQTRPALWAIMELYSRLLDHIVMKDFEVLTTRVSLSKWEKARILIRARYLPWTCS